MAHHHRYRRVLTSQPVNRWVPWLVGQGFVEHFEFVSRRKWKKMTRLLNKHAEQLKDRAEKFKAEYLGTFR
jgi:hypothetical protein